MSDGVLTSYSELADVLDSLPLLVRERRRADGLSLRAAAKQTDVGFNTIARLEKGDDCSLTNAITLVRWLGTRPAAPDPTPEEPS